MDLAAKAMKGYSAFLHTSFAIVSAQANRFNYYDITLIFLFNIIHLFAYREVVLNITILHHTFAHSQMVSSILMNH